MENDCRKLRNGISHIETKETLPLAKNNQEAEENCSVGILNRLSIPNICWGYEKLPQLR